MKTIADTALQSKDREAIAAATALLRERFPVVRIVLFGSKAIARDNAESDINLLVLTSDKLGWREAMPLRTPSSTSRWYTTW